MIESKRAQGARLLDETIDYSDRPHVARIRDRVATALDSNKKPHFDDLMSLRVVAGDLARKADQPIVATWHATVYSDPVVAKGMPLVELQRDGRPMGYMGLNTAEDIYGGHLDTTRVVEMAKGVPMLKWCDAYMS